MAPSGLNPAKLLRPVVTFASFARWPNNEKNVE